MRIFLILLVCLSGCAITPSTPIQSTNKLVVPLSGGDDDLYRLVDQRGNTVSRSTGGRNRLDFLLKDELSLNQCFTVRDKKGRNIFDGKAFALPRLLEYRISTTLKEELATAINTEMEAKKGTEFLYSQTRSLLESNRAFKDRRCYLPPQRNLPSKPWTRCSSRNQCLEEGSAICYSRFLGTEGCAIALRQLNIAGMLSSPGCAAAAANLAGEKYDMDDAFVDFLHGTADDVGNNMMEADSLLGNVIGAIIVGGNYAIKLDKAEQCTNRFVQQHYGPVVRWYSAVQNIKAEPELIKDACVSLIEDNNDHVSKINEYSESIGFLSSLLLSAEAMNSYLISKDQAAQVCRNGKFQRFGVISDSGITQYLIGTNLEPIDDRTRAGLLVTGLSGKDTPASKAGLEVGDVIVRVDGNFVNTVQKLVKLVQDSRGSMVRVEYYRHGSVRSIDVLPKKVFLSFSP